MSIVLPRQREVSVGDQPSDGVLSVCAAYGLVPRLVAPARDLSTSPIAREITQSLAPGEIGLLTGPSGSGKSLAMQAVRTHAGTNVIDAREQLEALLADDRAVIDAMDAPMDPALRALSLAGLAEPMLWVRSPATLSDGERARLAMAKSLHVASKTPGSWVLIDECCALLDAVTSQSVARTLRRWVSRSRTVRVLAASTREQLAGWLVPDHIWRLSL